MKKYLITGFNKYIKEGDSTYNYFTEIGWNCFPFEVVDINKTDPYGNPICALSHNVKVTASLFYFTYQEIKLK